MVKIKAILLMLEKNGKIIFGKRTKDRVSLPNMWSLPSEKIKVEEALEDAIERCAKHELGLEITGYRIFDIHHYKDEKEDKELYFVKVSYEGTPEIRAPEELSELGEYTLKEFLKKYKDEEIGHGLRYLRKKLKYWEKYDLRI